MMSTYRNRDYHNTRATREMSGKRDKFIRESKYSFLTAVIDQYAYLMDLKKEDFNLEYSSYMSHIRYTSRKKFKRQHDKLLEMAIMKACSDHYDDFSDNNLANFIKTYVANQTMNG